MKVQRLAWFGVVFWLLAGCAGHVSAQAQPPTSAALPHLLARSGVISLKVTNYDYARQQVMQAALAQGAEFLDAKTQVNEKGRKHGWMRFQLSASRLPFLLASANGLGKLYAENIYTADNASEYEELARRVGSLAQHQTRLDGVLNGDRRLRGSDILFLQERLFRANLDQGLLEQQRVDLARGAQESTLVVQFFEPGTLPPTPSGALDVRGRYVEAVGIAHAQFAHTLARGATAGAYVLVYAPVWLPILIVVFALLRWLWVRRRLILARVLALVTALAAVLAGWAGAVWERRNMRIGS